MAARSRKYTGKSRTWWSAATSALPPRDRSEGLLVIDPEDGGRAHKNTPPPRLPRTSMTAV